MAQTKGWEEQRGRHAQAGKGDKAAGSGFHGHSEEHAQIAKGNKTKNKGLLDKLKGTE